MREDKQGLKDYKKSFPGNYGSMMDFVKSYEFQEYDFRHKLIKSTVESQTQNDGAKTDEHR